MIGAFVMFVIAIPFFVVYFWSSQNWWALIPAGGMATIGVVVLLSGADRPNLLPGVFTSTLHSSMIGFVMFAGWALTFFVLWLQRGKQPDRLGQVPGFSPGAGGRVLTGGRGCQHPLRLAAADHRGRRPGPLRDDAAQKRITAKTNNKKAGEPACFFVGV